MKHTLLSKRLGDSLLKSILVLLFFFLNLQALTPQPQKIDYSKGFFVLNSKTVIDSETTLSRNAINYLQEHLLKHSNYQLRLDKTNATHKIMFRVNKMLDNEGYTLKVKRNKVLIEASHSAGFFYGMISLMQLSSAEIWSSTKLQEFKKEWFFFRVSIEDKPRFKWRGVLLDSARNFFTKEYIKLFIDRLAQYKINVFHWHLSDDEAWRLQIKKYPCLTQGDSFYTQEDIREIVAYAEARNVEIVPEIDVPAHSKVAVLAYPELLQDPNDKSKYKSVQHFRKNTIDAGLQSSYIFYENIVKELSQLFPSKYIHIGGDEIPKGAWSKSPAVQKLMKRHNYTKIREVKRHFIRKIEKMLKRHNRVLIGWEEVLNDLKNESSMIISWKSSRAGRKAAKQKRFSIMSPSDVLYLDAVQSKEKGELGVKWAGVNNIKDIYTYEPLSQLTKKESKYIYGVQVCLWSEKLFTQEITDYMTWPRLLAFSELAWSVKKSSYKEFQKRVLLEKQKLLVQNISYRK